LKALSGQPGANSSPTSTMQEMVLQQLKVGLAEAGANVAALRARVADAEQRYQQLRAAAESIPQIDAELAQLNRDYDIIKGQYNNLVTRRESAAMTGELEEAGKVADIRIIDPPRVDSKPAAPNRLLLIVLAFLAALGVGAGVSFFVSQILPTFPDGRTLRHVTKRPLLGTISMLERPAFIRARRRRNFVFYSALGSLTGSYAALAVVVYLFL
jgi:hypothetical protein